MPAALSSVTPAENASVEGGSFGSAFEEYAAVLEARVATTPYGTCAVRAEAEPGAVTVGVGGATIGPADCNGDPHVEVAIMCPAEVDITADAAPSETFKSGLVYTAALDAGAPVPALTRDPPPPLPLAFAGAADHGTACGNKAC